MSTVNKFRQMLTNKEVIIAPGVYDCVSAKVAEKTGFQVVYMGGFGAECIPCWQTGCRPDYRVRND